MHFRHRQTDGHWHRSISAISWSYSCGKLNDTPTFSRLSSRGCRCWCWRRGMRALRHTGPLAPYYILHILYILYITSRAKNVKSFSFYICWVQFCSRRQIAEPRGGTRRQRSDAWRKRERISHRHAWPTADAALHDRARYWTGGRLEVLPERLDVRAVQVDSTCCPTPVAIGCVRKTKRVDLESRSCDFGVVYKQGLDRFIRFINGSESELCRRLACRYSVNVSIFNLECQ